MAAIELGGVAATATAAVDVVVAAATAAGRLISACHPAVMREIAEPTLQIARPRSIYLTSYLTLSLRLTLALSLSSAVLRQTTLHLFCSAGAEKSLSFFQRFIFYLIRL